MLRNSHSQTPIQLRQTHSEKQRLVAASPVQSFLWNHALLAAESSRAELRQQKWRSARPSDQNVELGGLAQRHYCTPSRAMIISRWRRARGYRPVLV